MDADAKQKKASRADENTNKPDEGETEFDRWYRLA